MQRLPRQRIRKERFFFGLCATVLAFMNPVLLQQIGSSFSDITTTGVGARRMAAIGSGRSAPTHKVGDFRRHPARDCDGSETDKRALRGCRHSSSWPFCLCRFSGEFAALFYFGATLGTSFVLTGRAVVLSSWHECSETRCFRC